MILMAGTTLSAVFSGARGYQNGAEMEAKMAHNGIQKVQVEPKIEKKAIQNSDEKMTLKKLSEASWVALSSLG